MRAPVLLFIISLVGLTLALFVPNLADFIILAGPMALGSLWLVLRQETGALTRRIRGFLSVSKEFSRHRGFLFWGSKSKPKWVVIDGSNVMHWKDGEPNIETVQAVVAKLTAAGFSPGVVFDANAGYKLLGKYKHDDAFGRLLGLPADRVMVVGKGKPADPTILKAARELWA